MQLTNDPNWAELRDPKYRDEIKSAQLSATRDLGWGWFKALDVGLAYNQRDKSVTSDAFMLVLTGASDPALGLPLQAIPSGALRSPVTIDVVGIHQSVLTWDVPSIMSLYTSVPKDPWAAQTNKFARARKGLHGIPEAGYRLQLGSVPVHGNLGVQVVHPKQGSDGFRWNDGTGTPTGGR